MCVYILQIHLTQISIKIGQLFIFIQEQKLNIMDLYDWFDKFCIKFVLYAT